VANGSYMYDEIKRDKVEASKERIRKAPLIHQYDHHWDKSKISNRAKLLRLRMNIQLLIYDYIKVKEVDANSKEHSELGNMTIHLKDLAGELDIPIITFAQMSPYERKIADSRKIERYASTIVYFTRKSKEEMAKGFDEETSGNTMLWIDHNRNGESSEDMKQGINLMFRRNVALIEQSPYQPLLEDAEYL